MTIDQQLCGELTQARQRHQMYVNDAIRVGGAQRLEPWPGSSAQAVVRFEVIDGDSLCGQDLADACVFVDARDSGIRFVAPDVAAADNYVSYWHDESTDGEACLGGLGAWAELRYRSGVHPRTDAARSARPRRGRWASRVQPPATDRWLDRHRRHQAHRRPRVGRPALARHGVGEARLDARGRTDANAGSTFEHEPIARQNGHRQTTGAVAWTCRASGFQMARSPGWQIASSANTEDWMQHVLDHRRY